MFLGGSREAPPWARPGMWLSADSLVFWPRSLYNGGGETRAWWAVGTLHSRTETQKR